MTARPTNKQQVSRERNWRVFRLRGLAGYASFMSSPDRRELFTALIDAELKAIGAESETDRRKRWEQEWSKQA